MPEPVPDHPEGLAERVEQLESALRSRPTIEQAKGMIMVVHRCEADRAFDLLVAVSQSCNRKLRDVAALIVESLPTDRPLPVDVATALDARVRGGH